MAFTVTLHTVGPVPPLDDLGRWLTEQGEPYEREGLQTLSLRALPVRLLVDEERNVVQAQVDINPTLPLMRLVDLLFDLSVLAGADVRLAGQGEVTRPALWIASLRSQRRRGQSAKNSAERLPFLIIRQGREDCIEQVFAHAFGGGGVPRRIV